MDTRRVFSGLLLVVMAIMLGNLIVFDILAVVSDADSVQTQIEFVDTGGDLGDSGAILHKVAKALKVS